MASIDWRDDPGYDRLPCGCVLGDGEYVDLCSEGERLHDLWEEACEADREAFDGTEPHRSQEEATHAALRAHLWPEGEL